MASEPHAAVVYKIVYGIVDVPVGAQSEDGEADRRDDFTLALQTASLEDSTETLANPPLYNQIAPAFFADAKIIDDSS